MHGMIHTGLRKFVLETHGEAAWEAVLEEAGLPGKQYLGLENYSDEETVSIVMAASKLTETPAEEILVAFGKFIAPNLMRMYSALIDPAWKTFDFLLNIESTMHAAVRTRAPGSNPPVLQFKKIGDNKLQLLYDSPRRMTPVAIGIMQGVAEYFDEKVEIQIASAEDVQPVELEIEILPSD